MPSESRLLTLQRRFMGALGEPIFGHSRSLSELPRREGAVSASFRETAEALIRPSSKMEPVERLELYHRQYWYRLLDSIEEDFPGLKLLLGAEAFWSLMEAYLEAVPPASYTLRHLGAGLADFIAAHPKQLEHPVHAADLARLEYALMEIFEAGQRTPLSPEALGEGHISLQPHLRLLALRTAADDIWERAEDEAPLGALPPVAREPDRFLVVHRDQGGSLRVTALAEAEFAILESLGETHSLAETMRRIAARPGLLSDQDADRVGAWFGDFIGRAWLTAETEEDSPQNTERRSP